MLDITCDFYFHHCYHKTFLYSLGFYRKTIRRDAVPFYKKNILMPVLPVVEETVDKDPDSEQYEEGCTDIRPEKNRGPDDHDTKNDKEDTDKSKAEAMLV